ncbi:MAG TPA: penicillin acylase family protein, partial [Quisquiliibacterium sp.]|nr:penicillin acylase family protein [Quisquiliibacterium sp.]
MRIVRWIGWTLLALVMLAAGLVVAYRFAGMPQTRGELELAGAHEGFTVVRDTHGIPHVFASRPDDAYFALGLLHAQDRLWQLEMNRRIVAGRLAEVLGPGALETDRFLRTIGVRRNAERVHANLDAATRAALQAYADGVNAGIGLVEREPWKLPPEFLVLGVRPEKWSPVDSIGWSTMMAWDLSGNYANELLRFALSQRLDAKQLAELFETEPIGPLPDLASLYEGLDRSHVAQLMNALPPGHIDGIGSNNWVVDGRHTASGKPLLANDPHLGLNTPALWYFAHLSSPGLDVIGATLPGMPAVVLGRNQRIAWGFTNTGPDTQDLYLERIDPADPQRYRTPEGSAAFERRTELIRVKGAPDVQLEVRETRHGPVISDVHAQLGRTMQSRKLAERYVLAFRWAALTPDDGTMRASFELSRAANWQQFTDALRHFVAPQQNMVYADVDGNVGFIAPGRVPVRKPGNDIRGLAPVPGWDARYDWDGFIPYEELPRIWKPASGSVVTANQNILAPGYPHFITAEWTLPYRHDRIVEMLGQKQRHDAASFEAMQSDVASRAMTELLPLLVEARPATESGRAALERIRKWDARMLADAPEPLIATAWVDRLRKLLFEDEVGEELFPLVERQRVRTRAMYKALTVQGQEKWCDDVRTQEVERCAQVLDRALDESVQDLRKRYGDDIAAWRWGDAHAAVSEH